MVRGGVFKQQRFSLHDGDGIRTTVFLKGCPLNCAWCHNPESQSLAAERVYREGRCLLCGRCVSACERGEPAVVDGRLPDLKCIDAGIARSVPTGATELVGRDWDVAEVLAVVRRDVPFYDQSGGGVTISGGEPLYQPEFVEALLRACREEAIDTTLDTSGHAPPEVIERVVPLCDAVLYDVKHTRSAPHQEYTVVPNDQILENLARVRRITCATGASLRVRVPLVAGVNDDPEEAARLAGLVAGLEPPPPVDLLPYRSLATRNTERLGRRCRRMPPVGRASTRLRSAACAGLQVTIRENPIACLSGGAAAGAEPGGRARFPSERARLLTSFYAAEADRSVSAPVLRARAFAYLLAHKTVWIGADELIVGERGEAPRATPTFPELCCHTLEDLDILDTARRSVQGRAGGTLLLRAEAIPFWRGRTMRDRIFTAMTPEWLTAYRAGVFTSSWSSARLGTRCWTTDLTGRACWTWTGRSRPPWARWISWAIRTRGRGSRSWTRCGSRYGR
jgi:pyruvate formate lyase activating enzyme